MKAPIIRGWTRRILGWLLIVLTGALLLLLASPAPAMAACGVSYESGADPNAGCSGAAPVAGAITVGAAVLAAALGLAMLNFLRGRMSPSDLAEFLAAIAPVSVPEIARPAALPTGRADRALRGVRGIRNPRVRGAAGAEWARQVYEGEPERHFRVSPNDDPQFPVTTPGGRFVDVSARLPDGTILAAEVKTYGMWRTVTLSSGNQVVRQGQVPLSAEIREQVNKDVALRDSVPGYDPRWLFLGAGPSDELYEHLMQAHIIFIVYH